MAVLPDHVKAWQMSGALGSTMCIPVSGTNGWLPVLVSTLLAYTLKPWACLGSSDGVTAGMDGINRITSTAALVAAAAGSGSPRTWIVLRHPSGASVCIHLQPTTGAFGADTQIGISNSSAFTGGSTTARPTAVDEIFTDWDLLGGITKERMCVWHTEDGLQTMVLTQGSSFGGDDVQLQLFMGQIHDPAGSLVTWPRPFWFGGALLGRGGVDPHYMCGSGGGLVVMCEVPGSPGTRFTTGPYPTTEGFQAGTCEPLTQFGTVGTDGKRETSIFRFYVNSNGLRGYYGSWPDLIAWGRTEAEAWTAGGNGNFPDAERKWVQIGRLMYPWPGPLHDWVFP